MGEEVTDAELKWMDRAGVKGVRFNFIKRLVDFTPRDVLERIASAHRAARLAHRDLFRACRSARDGILLHHRCRPRVVFDHMACPNVKKGVDAPREPALPPADGEPQEFLDARSPARSASPSRVRPMTTWCRSRRTLVEQFPDRVIWGTDWPHPNMKKEAPDDGVLVDRSRRSRPPRRCRQALLVDNPMRLYWR